MLPIKLVLSKAYTDTFLNNAIHLYSWTFFTQVIAGISLKGTMPVPFTVPVSRPHIVPHFLRKSPRCSEGSHSGPLRRKEGTPGGKKGKSDSALLVMPVCNGPVCRLVKGGTSISPLSDEDTAKQKGWRTCQNLGKRIPNVLISRRHRATRGTAVPHPESPSGWREARDKTVRCQTAAPGQRAKGRTSAGEGWSRALRVQTAGGARAAVNYGKRITGLL